MSCIHEEIRDIRALIASSRSYMRIEQGESVIAQVGAVVVFQAKMSLVTVRAPLQSSDFAFSVTVDEL